MSPILGNDTSGHGLYIDLPSLIETRLLVQGMSGSGKSWLLRRLLEQTFGSVQQITAGNRSQRRA